MSIGKGRSRHLGDGTNRTFTTPTASTTKQVLVHFSASARHFETRNIVRRNVQAESVRKAVAK